MITFFRRLRQQLLETNQFRKYVIYAIGEIILVVIGILIALSVNNFNEKQKAVELSNTHLNYMLEDLTADTLYLNSMLVSLEEQLGIEEWILNEGPFSDKDIDSIKLSASNVNWRFHMNDRSFQNIQNSPDATLVGYEQLYSEISNYYIVTKNRIVQNNQLEIHAIKNKSAFEQLLHKNLPINTRQYGDYGGFRIGIDYSISSESGNFEEILESLNTIETKNVLYDKYARHSYVYLTLTMCDLEAKKLIKKIRSLL